MQRIDYSLKILLRMSVMLILNLILTHYASAQYQRQWIKKFSGTASTGLDYGNSIAVDKQNNIYIAGYVSNAQSSSDGVLIKYNKDGYLIWYRTYNDSINGQDYFYSLAVDDFGNAYMTGAATISGTRKICLTVKYDSSGTRKWVDEFDLGVNQNNSGKVVKVFNNKSVFVAAACVFDQSETDILLLKIDTSGAREWIRKNRGGNINNDIQDMVLDLNGNVYISGGTINPSTGWDFYTAKYSSGGDSLWAVSFDNNLSGDGALAMALDSLGNICVTGVSANVTTYNVCLVTLEYYPSGILKWYNIYQNNLSSFTDSPVDIGVDRNNYVYVLGFTCPGQDIVTNRDYLTIRYKPNGDTVWTRKYNGTGNSGEWPYALAVDRNNSVFVTGGSIGSGSNWDYFTIGYDTLGNTLWSDRYNGTGNAFDRAQCIALDNLQNIIVTGSSTEIGTGQDIVTIKYNKSVGLYNNNEVIPVKYNLSQNYPNPFNSKTMINYSVPEKSFVNISLYDQSGKEIMNIANGYMNAGNYSVIFDASSLASGVYFYKMNSGYFVQTKKMILLK